MPRYCVSRIEKKADLYPGIIVEVGNGNDRFDALYDGHENIGDGRKKHKKHFFYTKVKKNCLIYMIPDEDLCIKNGRIINKRHIYQSKACDEVGRSKLERAGFT